MTYRVLLPVSADEQYAKKAADVVTSLPGEDVHVVVLNVYEEFEVSSDEAATIDSESLFDESSFPESVTLVEELLEAHGIEVTKRREHGDPAEEILEVAEEIGAESIVLAGRKQSPIGKVLFGSVTQGVLLSSDIPVTVVLS